VHGEGERGSGGEGERGEAVDGGHGLVGVEEPAEGAVVARQEGQHAGVRVGLAEDLRGEDGLVHGLVVAAGVAAHVVVEHPEEAALVAGAVAHYGREALAPAGVVGGDELLERGARGRVVVRLPTGVGGAPSEAAVAGQLLAQGVLLLVGQAPEDAPEHGPVEPRVGGQQVAARGAVGLEEPLEPGGVDVGGHEPRQEVVAQEETERHVVGHGAVAVFRAVGAAAQGARDALREAPHVQSVGGLAGHARGHLDARAQEVGRLAEDVDAGAAAQVQQGEHDQVRVQPVERHAAGRGVRAQVREDLLLALPRSVRAVAAHVRPVREARVDGGREPVHEGLAGGDARERPVAGRLRPGGALLLEEPAAAAPHLLLHLGEGRGPVERHQHLARGRHAQHALQRLQCALHQRGLQRGPVARQPRALLQQRAVAVVHE